MANDAGTVYLEVLPELRAFGKRLVSQIDRPIDDAAKKAGANLENKLGRAGDRAGREMSGGVSRGSAKAKRAVDELAEQSQSRMDRAFKSIGTAAAVGFGSMKLGQLGRELGEQAVALDVFERKGRTVFEGSAADIDRWAKQNAASFGLTDRELAGLAAGFGDLVKPMGFTSAEAAKMSQEVVGLSGALSAWSGGQRDAQGVAEILTKAMLGERDGLKELGISISEADVQTRLLEKGQKDLTGAALQQATAVATQELIFEKSKDAQEAYANGSLDAVVKQNRFKAAIAEVREELALRFGPSLTVAGTALETLGPILAGVGGILQSGIAERLGGVATAAKAVGPALGALAIGFSIKAMFDALAPSVDKTAKALAGGKGGADEFEEALQRLNKPSAWEQIAANVKKNLNEGIFANFKDGIDSTSTKAGELFRKLAMESPAAAQQVITDMQAQGRAHGEFDAILQQVITSKGEQINVERQVQEKIVAAAGAMDGQTSAADRLKQATDNMNTALGEATSKLQALIGVHVSADAAAVNYQTQLAALSGKLQENGTNLDATTEKGRENREGVNNLITAMLSHIDTLGREGASMDDLRGNFNSHIEDLKGVLRQAGFTEEQVQALIDKYHLVPEDIETALRTAGYDEYWQKLERARTQAESLNETVGINAFGGVGDRPYGPAFAQGGFVPGYGDGDTVPAWLTPGEFVIRKAAVKAVGVDALEELNAQGYAAGGLVERPRIGFGQEYDFSLATSRIPDYSERLAAAQASVGTTWQGITAALDRVGMDYTVTSAYRPGDPGFHGRGKAVDLVGDMAAIFHTIAGFSGINELFFDPIGWFIDEGRRVSGAIGDHHDHVHAATFDQGGWLRPGWTMAYNGTGALERVSPVGGDAIDYDKLAGKIVAALATAPRPVLKVDRKVLGEVVAEEHHDRRRARSRG